jgi:cyclic pyranopterin phosphate synthase
MIFEIIPGVSVPFCGDCNRIRLDCQGALRACLYSREKLQLKPLLNAPDEEFVKVVTEFIGKKTGRVLEHIGSDMSSIGG